MTGADKYRSLRLSAACSLVNPPTSILPISSPAGKNLRKLPYWYSLISKNTTRATIMATISHWPMPGELLLFNWTSLPDRYRTVQRRYPFPQDAYILICRKVARFARLTLVGPSRPRSIAQEKGGLETIDFDSVASHKDLPGLLQPQKIPCV